MDNKFKVLLKKVLITEVRKRKAPLIGARKARVLTRALRTFKG